MKNPLSQENFRSLSRRLKAREQLLQGHPHLNRRWLILQTIMTSLRWQADWKQAVGYERILLSFKMASQGSGLEESQTGFLGPSLRGWISGIARLMQASYDGSDQRHRQVLEPFVETAGVGWVAAAVYLNNAGKKAMQQHDLSEAVRGSLLYRELGLSFLIGTHTAEEIFRSIAKKLGFKDEGCQRTSDIALFFFLSLLILIEKEKEEFREDFLEGIVQALSPTLESVGFACATISSEEKRECNGTMAKHWKEILEKQELSANEKLNQVFASVFDALDLNMDEVKQEMGPLASFCEIIIESHYQIVNQAGRAATTMTHAA